MINMAFSLLRLGSRASLGTAMERSALTGAIVNINDTTPKRSFPTHGCVCNGTSCPLDISRLSSSLRRSSMSGTLASSAPSSISTHMVRRNFSKRPEAKGKRTQEDSGSESDSDSDTECKGKERSEFWRRKMRTFHGLLDVNKDGVISYDDFQLLAKRFADLGHLDEAHAEEFRTVVRLTWEELWGEITPYNLVTVEQYLADMNHVLSDKALKGRAYTFLPYLFKAVDKDASGFIAVEEFKLFFKCLGLSEETAAVSFAIIDKNGDGKLSLKEFLKLGKDFFFTEDEKRVSKMFWGPLASN